MCETKTCTKCGETKPVTEFYAKRSEKSGLTARCKVCFNAAVRAYRGANKESLLEAARRWKRSNPEKVRESARKWQKANPEISNEMHRRWVAENPDKRKAIQTRADRKRSIEMPDWYVKSSLLKLPTSAEVPQTLIELKRAQIQLHRAIYERNPSPQ